jgi:hypothetical protein
MPYSYPPPGYPLPFHAACYYPHHPMQPTVFYPPGSLPPHHHVNPMNPYNMHTVDPTMYPNMNNMVPPSMMTQNNNNNAMTAMVTENSMPMYSSSGKVTAPAKEIPPPGRNRASSTESSSGKMEGPFPTVSPKIRKKDIVSLPLTVPPPPPPCGDSPKDFGNELMQESTGSSKTMTREQFYKIRPKLPRISKTDPRRLYAAAFGDAYNSCDFEEIWDFVSNYCTKDVLFIHRWVGTELYLNFPKYLEVRGIESVAEYWYSRCLVAPDLVLENKETKLYVRSDGISTVLSSFTIVCTRLYDGEISDSIICRPADDAAGLAVRNSSASGESDEDRNSPTLNETQSRPEDIYNRVWKKVDRILCRVEPPPKRRALSMSKTPEEEEAISISTATTCATISSTEQPSHRKRMPKDQSITLLGTVTLHLNVDFKIRQIELNFALQQ